MALEIANTEGYYYDKSQEGRDLGEKQVVKFLNQLICHGCECSQEEDVTQEAEKITQEVVRARGSREIITDHQFKQYLTQGYIQ